MSQQGKFTFRNRGVCLWLGSVLVVAAILLASGKRGWWIWCFLGMLFIGDAARSRQMRGVLHTFEHGRRRWWRFDPLYLTMYEGCCLWAGVILLATMGLGFMLF